MEQMTDNARLQHLDGIRGIASILVVLCHMSCVFFPSFYKRAFSEGSSQIFLDSPLNVLTNGHTAVQCFFVLSGYLITRKMYLNQEQAILSPVVQYTKLIKVVLPAVLLAAILMGMGCMMHLKAVVLDPTLVFVNGYNDFEPTIRSVFTDVFYWTFKSGSSYVGPLWTIHIEFVGSLLIAPISFFASKKPNLAKIFYLVLCFSLLKLSANKEFVPFVLGAFAFDCVYNYESDKSSLGKLCHYLLSHKWPKIILLLLGIYLACANRYLTGWYLPLGILSLNTLEMQMSLWLLAFQ